MTKPQLEEVDLPSRVECATIHPTPLPTTEGDAGPGAPPAVGTAGPPQDPKVGAVETDREVLVVIVLTVDVLIQGIALVQEKTSKLRSEQSWLGRRTPPPSGTQPPSAAALATAPLYPKATEEELAAAGGILVDRANITIEVLPDNILQKIQNDEYIEMADLVFKLPTVFALVESQEDELKYKSKDQKPKLSCLDWLQAFQLYSNAYVQFHPSAARDLSRYLYFITGLMRRKGSKWQAYDEKFRKDRKALRLRWSEYRQQLHAEAIAGTRELSPSPMAVSQSFANRKNAICFFFLTKIQ